MKKNCIENDFNAAEETILKEVHRYQRLREYIRSSADSHETGSEPLWYSPTMNANMQLPVC